MPSVADISVLTISLLAGVVSLLLAIAGSAAGLKVSDFALSRFGASPAETALAVSCGAAPAWSRGVGLPPDEVASVIVIEAFAAGRAALASAVWVCSRNGVDAGDSAITSLAPSACPRVDLSSRFAS